MKKYANSIYIDRVLNINIWGTLGLNTVHKYFPVLIFFLNWNFSVYLCLSWNLLCRPGWSQEH